MLSDEHLVELYNSGDMLAFDELYHRYEYSAYNYTVRLAGSRDEGNDVYQSVWLKIVDKRDDFVLKIKKDDPPFIFKSYFFAMLRNAIFDKKGKNKYDVELDESTLNDADHANNNLENEVIAEANIASLLNAIDSLPFHQKETFLLIKECGLSLKEAAEVQGISIETAKTRRRYAYNRLKPILEQMH